RGERILSALRDVSQELNAPAAQVALAWLLSRPALTAAIASAQPDEILAAVDLNLSSAGREARPPLFSPGLKPSARQRWKSAANRLAISARKLCHSRLCPFTLRTSRTKKRDATGNPPMKGATNG